MNQAIIDKYNNSEVTVLDADTGLLCNYVITRGGKYCFMLVDSNDLHNPNMDGILVKRRISKQNMIDVLERDKVLFSVDAV